MRAVFLIISFLSIIACNPTDSKEKFSVLEKEDLSDFKGYSITYRKGSYLISNANNEEDEKTIWIRKGFTGKIKYIRDSNDVFVTKSKKETEFLENILRKFDQLDVAYLSVDNKENIRFGFFDRHCHYSFLKLSKNSTLKDLNKTYFEKYKDNWYLDKSCAD